MSRVCFCEWFDSLNCKELLWLVAIFLFTPPTNLFYFFLFSLCTLWSASLQVSHGSYMKMCV